MRPLLPVSLTAALLAGACNRGSRPADAPREVTAVDSPVADGAPIGGLRESDAGVGVWGAADLHAHPAGHFALGGSADGTGGILFGRPDIPTQEHGRVWLSAEDSCDGETHVLATTDFVTRLTHSIAFSLIGSEGRRAHSAMVARPDPDERPFENWPNARDLYHQQMYVEGIRRAFEGGLRLMFASVTENQTLSRLMNITLAPGSVALDPHEDLVSAEEQLRFIRRLAHDNADFMAIATSPAQARDIILSGRLALVLGLELDYVPIEDVRRFYDEYGVRTIIPIHLADNPVGGAAAYTPIFNTHTALFSLGLGATEMEFYALREESCITRRLDRPLFPELPAGVVLLPRDMPWERYLTDVGYESCASCGPGGADAFRGHRNALGVRNAGYLLELMRMGMLLDMVHMSIESTAETLDLAERWHYPVLNTHSGVSLEGERVAEDRELPLGLARRIYRVPEAEGLVGLGTGPIIRTIRTLFHASGLPLCRLEPSSPACNLDAGDGVPSCGDGVGEDGIAEGDLLRWRAENGCPISGAGSILLRLCDGRTIELGPVTCGGPPVRVPPLGGSTVESIAFRATPNEPWCSDPVCGGRDSSNVSRMGLAAGAQYLVRARPWPDFDLCRLPLAGLGPAAVRTSSATRWTCAAEDAFDASCHMSPSLSPAPEPPTIVDASVNPSSEWHVLRTVIQSGGGLTNRVRGASASYGGARVLVHASFDGVAGPIEFDMNQGGLWTGSELHSYRVVRGALGSLQSVSVEMAAADGREEAWSLDELLIEEIEDPLIAWAHLYAEVQGQLATALADGTGAISPHALSMAIGTDLNGFAPAIPISGVVPAARTPFEMCVRDYPPGLGDPCRAMLLADRGVAGYAMLADFFDALETLQRYFRGTDVPRVYDALMSSAEATIRVWERAEARAGMVGP